MKALISIIFVAKSQLSTTNFYKKMIIFLDDQFSDLGDYLLKNRTSVSKHSSDFKTLAK